jgi:hypothetical protein
MWEDEVDNFNPCERPQHEITAGRGTEVQVPNLFLGTKEELEIYAEQYQYSEDQREVVTFHSECEDFLNQFDNFGLEETLSDNEENDTSDRTEDQWAVVDKTLERYDDPRCFAHSSTMADAKDIVVLYSWRILIVSASIVMRSR